MIRRPPRSTQSRSSAASDVYKRQEVDIGVQVLPVECVDQRGPALGNMAVTELLADDGGVLAFRQGIVIAVSRARLGELDAQLLQQGGDPFVDVFRTVV